MVGEAMLTFTQFILGPCLSVWTFLILPLCISTLWFSEIRFWYIGLKLILTPMSFETRNIWAVGSISPLLFAALFRLKTVLCSLFLTVYRNTLFTEPDQSDEMVSFNTSFLLLSILHGNFLVKFSDIFINTKPFIYCAGRTFVKPNGL